MPVKPHTHETTFSIVKAPGIVAVVAPHAALRTPLETFAYYFNTAVFFFVAGYSAVPLGFCLPYDRLRRSARR